MHHQLGNSIKKLREERNLTLKNVSEMTGLSIGFLSQVERDITDPSISSLKKIAEAFGVRITEFFEKYPDENCIVRKEQRSKLLLGNAKVIYELLAPSKERKMEPILKTIEPNACSGKVEGHEGEEFALIIQGKLEVCLGDKVYILEEGDSIYFDANQPHQYKNNTKDTCVCVWVVTPPAFS